MDSFTSILLDNKIISGAYKDKFTREREYISGVVMIKKSQYYNMKNMMKADPLPC